MHRAYCTLPLAKFPQSQKQLQKDAIICLKAGVEQLVYHLNFVLLGAGSYVPMTFGLC